MQLLYAFPTRLHRFSADYARVKVLELRGERQIRIRVSGRNRRDLLVKIVRALDELHRGFPRLRYERQIPCNCAACTTTKEPHFYDLGDLQERLAFGKDIQASITDADD